VPIVMIRGIDEMGFTVAFAAGGNDLTVIVEAMVGNTTDIGPQVVLDTLLLGDTAVKTLLETDKTLGGAVEDLFVTRMSGVKVFNLPHKHVLGAEWVVEMVLTD